MAGFLMKIYPILIFLACTPVNKLNYRTTTKPQFANNVPAEPLKPSVGAEGSSTNIDQKTDLISIQPKSSFSSNEEKFDVSSQPLINQLLSKEDISIISALKLERFPEVTVMLVVKSVRRTGEKIIAAGGRVDYDPNLNQGDTIPFLIATLPPEKLVDDDFIRSIEPKAMQLDHALAQTNAPLFSSLANEDVEQLFVPLGDINVPKLQKRFPDQALGGDVIVAVIDTGVDASHHVFEDRVIYWSDETQEGRIPMTLTNIDHGNIIIEDKVIALPESLVKYKEVYVGIIDERLMGSQVGDEEKVDDKEGLDINRNQLIDDKFLVVAALNDQDKFFAYVDTNGNLQFEESEIQTALVDFNEWRTSQKQYGSEGMVKFPSLSKTIKYPVIFETNRSSELKYITLGMDLGSHGTHVAGIIAANGKKLKGAAPKAKIMSLKVCSGISCTEAAMLRGIIKAFYNSQGYTPDIVNISLGSLQSYRESVFDFVIRDLAAKFGATFFISASNSGPGHRTLNGVGSLSPAVLVGAHVSRETLQKHYNLNPDVEIQKHNLLFFSSVGPSYTGELRPNIVAPGSALSSTPLIDIRSAMYNGTSMSSPLAAGAAAALLSKVKTADEYKFYQQLKAKKLEAMRTGNNSTPYSLITFPLTFRTALENSATTKEFDNYTMVQIGHGLIDISSAYDELTKQLKLQRAAADNAEFSNYLFNVKINNNAEQGRLYDRSLNQAPPKTIAIALNPDGEESEQSLDQIETTPMIVRLTKIQMQDHQGNIKEVDLSSSQLPFSIANTLENGNGRETTLILNNTIKSQFTSVRHYAHMKAGYTYVAHYGVFKDQQRLLSIMDTIHKPIILNELEQTAYLPGISSEMIKDKLIYAKRAQSIKPSEFQRYPIAITPQDTQLTSTVGFDPNASGRLLLQIYDPDGKELGFKVIMKSDELPSQVLQANIQANTTGKPGIYEILVSNYSGRWMVPSKYDLLVRTSRFQASTQSIKIKAGENQIVSIANASQQVKTVRARIDDLHLFAALNDFEVIPNYRTFKQIDLPAGQNTIAIELQLSQEQPVQRQGWWGRIDHRLYTLDENGQLIAAYYGSISDNGKSFMDVGTDKPLYAAIDTFSILPEDAPLSAGQKAVNLEAHFADIDAGTTMEVEDISVASNVFLLNLTAPPSLDLPLPIRGFLNVTTNHPDISLSIPVTLAQ